MGKIINYARIYYNWKMGRKTALGYAPEDISIELTNTCNFRCRYCLQSDPGHFKTVSRSNLSPDEARVLIRRLRDGGVKTNVMHWTLDGEPFINKNINEISSIAIDHGFRHFIFSTNGYFCTHERVKGLPSVTGVTYTLCIDFCTDRSLFEEIRGTPDSWERVRLNIERVLKDGMLGHVKIRVTDISSFETGNGRQPAGSLAQLRSLFPHSDRLTVVSRIFHNATGFVPGILERKRESKNGGFITCPHPWASLVIASNGDVVACSRDLQHKTVLGNLLSEDLASVWNGEAYQRFRRAWLDKVPETIPACRECDLRFDEGKFTVRHIMKTGINRLGILKR
ncbi:MAG TPA: SPASM domain-containing protein [Deltaproteobacteria bacterium]|nr:SPASM domain-containing protein [Deltaproteobacteria bacterium]HQI00588.1 SPASM domain-containing protein [Deltaproteobacteria bacterium]